MADRNHYFVRVNGETEHNNPAEAKCYVRDEPPEWPAKFFDYADLCLKQGFVRIGWPGVGNLRDVSDVPQSTACYPTIKPHIRQYLDQFRNIPIGSVILMPDKSRSGIIYIGETRSAYHYSTAGPFECAHRIDVAWDHDGRGPIEYNAADLTIPVRGGWWLRAFRDLSLAQDDTLIARIDAQRMRQK